MSLAVVGELTLAIRVVNETEEARTRPARRPLQHLQIAVRVSECEDRPAPDEAVDADGLAGAVVDELDLGLLHEDRLPVRADLELGDTGRADDLLRRDAVDARPAKTRMNSTPPPETMNVLKPLARRYAEELQHRLVDELV